MYKRLHLIDCNYSHKYCVSFVLNCNTTTYACFQNDLKVRSMLHEASHIYASNLCFRRYFEKSDWYVGSHATWHCWSLNVQTRTTIGISTVALHKSNHKIVYLFFRQCRRMEWMGCLLTRCRSAVRVETLYRHPLLAPLAQRRPATGRSDSSWLQCYIH